MKLGLKQKSFIALLMFPLRSLALQVSSLRLYQFRLPPAPCLSLP